EVVGLGARGALVLRRGQARLRPVPHRAHRARRGADRQPARALRGARHPRAGRRGRPARRAHGGRGSGLGLHGRARPRGPRPRQEPARPGPPAPRRPRARAGRRRAPRGRGAGPGRAGGRARRRRGPHPVRRRLEHLGIPRGARRRGAHRDLRGHEPARPGAVHRRDLAPGARAGRRLRAAPRGAARRPRLHARPLPRLLHPLHARRLDRHALVGHAVRPLRGRGGPHPRRPRRHARRRAGHPARPERLDRAEPAGDGAGQRGPPRRHHGGHRPGPPGRRQPGHPRLPLPLLGRGPGGHAGDRLERGGALDHARLGRPGDPVLLRHAQDPDVRRPAEVRRAAAVPHAPARLRRQRDGAVLHRLRGHGAARGLPAQAGRQGRRAPRRAVHRRRAGRPVRPEEVRHAVHPRLAPGPRRPRRRLGDRGPVGGAPRRLRRGEHRGPRRLRAARRARLPHVPPVALLPRGRVPVLHVRLRARGRARAPGAVRHRQGRDPAGVRRRGRDALPPPRGGHGARAVARAGRVPGRRRDAAGAARRRRPGAESQPGQDPL
ncbi:MAG: Alkyldihydroxyacetonephosphate synthase, partial [uncultured Solirubrobacteraceae bacterium]